MTNDMIQSNKDRVLLRQLYFDDSNKIIKSIINKHRLSKTSYLYQRKLLIMLLSCCLFQDEDINFDDMLSVDQQRNGSAIDSRKSSRWIAILTVKTRKEGYQWKGSI
eukprot:GHVR01019385.1.p1 GENE.GHVR01019385.1~~GHVR01019385.1.p1  ORF type:complete len:107 (-),score=8.46 GHVR01019385.1:27-347(-)